MESTYGISMIWGPTWARAGMCGIVIVMILKVVQHIGYMGSACAWDLVVNWVPTLNKTRGDG